MLSGGDLGSIDLGGTLIGPIAVTDSTGTPKDPTVAPTFRVYGNAGSAAMPNGTGSATQLDTGSITNATSATPIAVTSASHGLQTGTRVVVSGVLGNTAANGEFTITRVDANTFTLDGSVGNGAYISGGVWHVAGLYQVSISVAGGDGYEAGETYSVLVNWTISATPYAALHTFSVV